MSIPTVSTQHMFAASFVNNSPTVQSSVAISGAKAPFWIRVQRTGNVWTESWSVDGTNFTQAASFNYTTGGESDRALCGELLRHNFAGIHGIRRLFLQYRQPDFSGGWRHVDATTAPVISSVNSTNVTSTGATIVWTTDQFSSSRVDYGTTTGYGTMMSNSTSVLSHSLVLTGLTCNQQYHYKVSSTDANGYTGSSGDNTFTTGSCGSPSGPTSDDFHSMSLNTSLWTVVNPVGDGSVSLNGLDAVLSVPAGTPHDLWTSGNQTRANCAGYNQHRFSGGGEIRFDSHGGESGRRPHRADGCEQLPAFRCLFQRFRRSICLRPAL